MTSRRPPPSSAIAAPTGPSAVRSALVRAIDAAAVRVGVGQRLSTEDVHDTRKRIKRARSALRVLRPALDDDAFSGCDRLLRAAGRSLSTARDAAVLAQTSARLRARLEGASPPKINEERRRHNLPGASTADAARAHRNLRRAAATLAGARLQRRGWIPLGSGVRVVYKHGRRIAADVKREATTEALHAWRRHAKRYWHVLEIFEVVNPTRLAPIIGNARRLSDLLGEDHDLAMLAERIRSRRGRPQTRDVALLSAIEERRARLGRRASRIGSKVYADRARDVERRLQTDWERWRHASAQSTRINAGS
jgi:CHAD domain-containing protein